MRALLAGGLLLLVVSLGMRLSILRTLDFDPDEMQHLHIAWCISEGLIPYRDFFEHHTPGMHFALVPLLRAFPVATDPEAAVRFIFLTRTLMVLVTAGILALVFLLGRLWRGWRVGLVASVLLVNEHLFLWKTLEIRPDGPGLALLLASLVTILRARHPGLFLASGAMLGGAVLCSLKTLFAGPPILLALLLRRERAGNLAAWCAGFALPVLLILAGFAAHGALPDFLDGTLGVSARWKERFSPVPYLLLLSPGVALLALAGLVRYGRSADDRLIAFCFGGLFAGAFVISVPWPQYHLLYLPFGALLAAALLVDLTGRRDGILALATLALAAWPFAQMTRWPLQTNEHSLRQIRFVIAHSRPDETVLDGWMSRAPFRPHAYRYYFLNDEMRLLLPPLERRHFLFALQDGRIAPKLIMLDEHLQLYCPEAVPFYHRYYQPTEVGPIWIRRGPGNHATDSLTIPTSSR